jgi:molybdopterin biosynthesis enzyme
VASLEEDDVGENDAALRVARATAGDGLRLSDPSTGRVNLLSLEKGVLRVDARRLAGINSCSGITMATLFEDENGELELARRLQSHIAGNADLIILAGETAIMDRQDITPRAIERAGGEVECYGVPVDPGNTLLLAYLQGVPVLGAPGCVRSPMRNIIDMILPRLLVGEHLNAKEIFTWGHGGLLADVRERPFPREKSNRQDWARSSATRAVDSEI